MIVGGKTIEMRRIANARLSRVVVLLLMRSLKLAERPSLSIVSRSSSWQLEHEEPAGHKLGRGG